jgi:transcriptional regulator with XRE-family HTH domain
MVTSAQLRAARGLLDWSVRDLAARAGVHRNTVTRAETELGGPGHAVAQMARALEAAGVEFLDGDQPGVRFRAWSAGERVRLRLGCEKYAETIGLGEHEIATVQKWARLAGDPPGGRALLRHANGGLLTGWVPTALLERTG